MKMEELTKEFILDCKVRNLAPRTVRNYEKQLAYFLRFLKETEDVETLEELKPIHIKNSRRCLVSFSDTSGYTI